MNITYNNRVEGQATNMITFTDIPNILKVLDDDYGSKAYYTLTFVGNLKGETNKDEQWYITLFGDTITNVLDPSNAVNKSFFVGQSPSATAASVARALRSCPNLAANFSVEHDGTSVTVTAYDNGSLFNGTDYFSTNIAQAYMGTSGQDGSASSDLQGALIDVDVYTDSEYVTTLEKNWYNGEAAFDMSPVLTTLSEYGRIMPYSFKISSLKGENYAVFGNIVGNYTSVGYMCNQGYKFLDNEFQVAQNYSRGAVRDVANNTILYLYKPSIDLSLYTGNNGGFTYKIEYLDSALNLIYSAETSVRCSSNSLLDFHITLDSPSGTYSYFNSAFYIDLTISHDKIRYNVIKPLKATEYSQRILWRNSYGGISFYDFTGQRSETRDLDLSTYQKNIFGYYDNTKNELNRVYNNEVDYTVTLKSHLFEHDGKYIFNDLLQSAEVWTVINGETYGILIDSISVEEQNQNNIYEATLRYKYSQKPSLL